MHQTYLLVIVVGNNIGLMTYSVFLISFFLVDIVLYKLHANIRSSEKDLNILYGLYVRTQKIFTACKKFTVFQYINIFGFPSIFW